MGPLNPYRLTQSVTPTTPNPPTQSGTDTSRLWRSDQPSGSDLRVLYAGQGWPPEPLRNIPGSEYKYIPPTPSPAAPPAQPPAPLSAIGSQAGKNIVTQPTIQGPAIPGPVITGQVF